ncbi:olfactory receptor 6M1-like [Tachyglossus aculeatus]|uniref:olfactory receptor 6M1-like n=1 Tax=Tachyglossus aculeatus TaxID=9261 RepID=UPI0018F35B37|nr:olfactory receptor 6M1-like [Tachyglossus aculeatus]
MGLENWTAVTEIILVGIPTTQELGVFLFLVFLSAYVVTVLGNLIIIMLIRLDYRLHSPMYFFLSHFSFSEILTTTCVVPRMLVNFLSERKSVSFHECFTQLYFYFLFGSTEFIFFAIMSYDRYVAICHPLRYPAILTRPLCARLVTLAWFGSFLLILPSTLLKARLPYCGPNIIDHFFCDSAPFLHLACTDVTYIELLDFIVSLVLLIGSLAMTIVSYFYVIFTILKIPSDEGRRKAFSTCASHFTVVSMGYGISIFVYVRPNQKRSLHLNKILFVLSSVVTPLLNPFIFSLRNETMKIVLSEALGRVQTFTKDLRLIPVMNSNPFKSRVTPVVHVTPIEKYHQQLT